METAATGAARGADEVRYRIQYENERDLSKIELYEAQGKSREALKAKRELIDLNANRKLAEQANELFDAAKRQ